MQTLIIEVENDKIKALKSILNAFGINYHVKKSDLKDTTDYLLSSSANKKRLKESIAQLRNGEIEVHNLIEE